MEDVARATGLHRTTVSLALRDSPRLPAETRAKVREAARRMGYRPDPLVSALMSARAGRRRPGSRALLAFLGEAGAGRAEPARSPGAYAQMYRGAKARAEERGHSLAWFHPGEQGMSDARLSRVLFARGVQGLIVGPRGGAAHRMGIEWERFSVVELGYNLASPAFHRVVHDYFHSMREAFSRAREAGGRRVGLLLSSAMDEKVHHLWRAAFADCQRCVPAEDRVEPLLEPELDEARARAWLRREEPDVIVGVGRVLRERLPGLVERRSFRAARFIDLACHRRDGSETGIFQDWPAMGGAAVDWLISLVQRGERGVPGQAQSLLLSGVWVGEAGAC